MTKIIGISGSLRQKSFNTLLLRNAIELAPTDCEVTIVSIKDFPLYDGDIENNVGIPQQVAQLKDQIANADGLLLVTPEYNNGVPGVLKNAIDWLSRPAKDIPRVFGDKPLGLIGASPGKSGTRFAQAAWLPIFRALGARPWFGRQLHMDQIDKIMNDEGKIVDDKIKELVKKFMAGFVEFVVEARAVKR